MHGKNTDLAGHSDMGGGTGRAERGAARGWERRRTTRTALAAGLAVLGTLVVLLRHRPGTDVATSTVGKTAPGATDVGAGGCAHTANPVGGEKYRLPSSEWISSPRSCPTGNSLSQDECHTDVGCRETPCVGGAGSSDGAAEGAGEPRANTGTGDGDEQTASERAGQGESRGCGMPQTRCPITGFDPTEASVKEQI